MSRVLITLLALTIAGCGNTNSSVSADSRDISGVLATGRNHTVALKNDGTVWAWGNNYYGQLGNGTTTDSNTPAQINGVADVKAVSAGTDFSVALKNDGTVWTWGYNYYGRLGDWTTTDRGMPVQVKIQKKDNDGNLEWETDRDGNPTLDSNGNKIPKLISFSGVSAIAAGDGFTIALKDDWTVWAWGVNRWYGQLGNGTMTDSNTPVQVVGLSGVTAIAAGSCNTVALKNDGTVWTWGDNANGELGAGNDFLHNFAIFPYSKTPVPVCATTDASTGACLTYLTGINAIASGDRSTFALKSDGTVWAWGANWNGQLGDGTTTDQYLPVQVTGLTGITAISAGFRHTIALKNDGTVWSWGVNWSGQLGDGTTLDRNTPVLVTGLAGVVAISAGNSVSAVLRDNGTVWTWGANYGGQLGNGTTTGSLTPVQVEDYSVL